MELMPNPLSKPINFVNTHKTQKNQKRIRNSQMCNTDKLQIVNKRNRVQNKNKKNCHIARKFVRTKKYASHNYSCLIFSR